MKLLLITGLPASGKSTLAKRLSQRYGLPLLAKDCIKEPLLDVLGAQTPAQSRKLSDASFAVMFALARELVQGSTGFILEGNFRPGEHEAPLQSLLSAGSVSLAQVLCRIDEAQRLHRLASRGSDSARHPGHRDAHLISAAGRVSDAFLSLAGERMLYEGDEHTLLALDAWWREPL
jgi:predicted kinase